jgi:spermidine synthase
MIHPLRLAILGLLALAVTGRTAPAAEKTLYKKVTPYTTILVTENEKGLRTLWFTDEDSPQSTVKVGDPDHVELEYAQAMPVALALVPQARRVLIVGLGGGTIPSLLRKHYPRMTIDVVDIDPDVVDAAKKFFGFREDPLMRVYVEDGRKFIAKCKEPYDIIFLDAYGNENIPYDLATKEFLQSVRRAVAPKGVVASNIWAAYCNPLHDPMVRTYQEVFDATQVIEVKGSGNEIVLALPYKVKLDRADLTRRASQLSKDNALRFDVGEYVRTGLQDPAPKDPEVPVLLDKDKGKYKEKVGEKEEPSGKEMGKAGSLLRPRQRLNARLDPLLDRLVLLTRQGRFEGGTRPWAADPRDGLCRQPPDVRIAVAQ